MKTATSRFFIFVLMVMLLSALAACGGDDETGTAAESDKDSDQGAAQGAAQEAAQAPADVSERQSAQSQPETSSDAVGRTEKEEVIANEPLPEGNEVFDAEVSEIALEDSVDGDVADGVVMEMPAEEAAEPIMAQGQATGGVAVGQAGEAVESNSESSVSVITSEESEESDDTGFVDTGAVAGGDDTTDGNTATGADNTTAPEDMPADMFFTDYGVNPFLDTEDDHLSTFAMDVDTASYTLARNYLTNVGTLPPPEAIRPEEFINYFDMHYESPGGDDAFEINLDMAPAPFGYDGHYLLRVGIQGRYIHPDQRDPAFLIFVIDVSGSMSQGNRLGLVKESLEILMGELREDDRVAIVVYSDNSRVVLEPTPAGEADTIMNAINNLQTEGSTNVEAGLQLGYDLAKEYKGDGDGITRVIVLSDGVGNVGNTDPEGILKTIKDAVDEGITLSTIGFGMGNYNDIMMEQLADDGNGNYFYVDTLREAKRVFVYNLTGTLQVIGYDAKVQVDFNPEVADRYRLIGYENRDVADEDFRNDTVDAGEVGAGHSVTALYELALEDANPGDVIATVYIRYEDATTRDIVEINKEITVEDVYASINDAPARFRLAAAVAEFSELLRESYWAQDGNYVDLLTFAEPLTLELPDDENVLEFVELIRAAGRFIDR